MRTLDRLYKKNLRLAELAEDDDYEERPTRYRGKRHYRQAASETFKCKHCRRFIGPVPCGGHHRNHCPFCLYSRHVDEHSSGDRLSACGSAMAPIGYFRRIKGEYVVVHHCLGCGFERFNRIAADDDFELVISLPELLPRSKHDIQHQSLEYEVALD